MSEVASKMIKRRVHRMRTIMLSKPKCVGQSHQPNMNALRIFFGFHDDTPGRLRWIHHLFTMGVSKGSIPNTRRMANPIEIRRF